MPVSTYVPWGYQRQGKGGGLTSVLGLVWGPYAA